MRKRVLRYLPFLIGCAFLAGTEGYYLSMRTPRAGIQSTPPPTGINSAAYRRIKEGMRLEVVEGIIGVPPGDYRDNDGKARAASPWQDMGYVDVLHDLHIDSFETPVDWCSNQYGIIVWLNERGEVYDKGLCQPLKH